jgi:arylsulfatase A-like enzyme
MLGHALVVLSALFPQGPAAEKPQISFEPASVLTKARRTLASREPALVHAEDAEAAKAKLEAVQKRFGKRPNIVWLVIDDMGYGDPGCYGGGAVVGAATPNIDRLAAGGLQLLSCYSQPTCTPTRSAILTGRLPVRTGLIRPVLAGDKLTRNPWADEISLPAILSKNGYATVLCGKWHIGESEGMRPHDVGFDEYFGFYPAQKELSQSHDKRRYPDLVLNPERLAMLRQTGASESLIHGFRGGKTEEVKKVESIDDVAQSDRVLKEFSVRRIGELAKAGKPFFFEHTFMKCHADNFPSPEFEGKSASKYPYKDAVVEVDAYVGEIIGALEAAGVLENTLVFVTSDNGPQRDSWPDTGYTPFHGGKGSAWEGGVRVPGIAYWPGTIEAGRTSTELFDLMDLFLTSIHLAGADADVPTDRYIDSIDQTSFLLADNGQSNREKVFMWCGTDLMAVRVYEYKLHHKVVVPARQWLDIDMSTQQSTEVAPWLFNLFIDPGEEYAVGHRMNAFLAPMGAELKAHAATFRVYPPKNIGLGAK